MALKVGKSDLEAAVKDGKLPANGVEPLWEFLEERLGANATLNLSTAITYLGGGLVAVALGWFGIRNYELITALQVATGLTIFAILSLITAHRTYKQGSMIQSSVFATMAVMATPLVVLSLQVHFNYWPLVDSIRHDHISGSIRDFNTFIDARWLTVELSTLAMALAIFAAHRTPYILLPVTLVFFWMVMDFSMYQANIAEKNNYSQYHKIYEWNCAYFGLAAIAAAGAINWFKTTQVDMPYWIYTAGVISFWGGLVSMGESGDWKAFQFCMVNVALFLIGGVLQRGIFISAGVVGIFMYIARLVDKTFREDPLFPLYIAATGVILVAGVVVTRPLHKPLMNFLHSLAPERLRREAVEA